MSAIVLIDTSIYLNLLDIPGSNQNRSVVDEEFRRKALTGDYFYLPMAAIWETGNHISRLATGDLRREYARKFVDDVREALNGNAPYRPTYFPSREVFIDWLGRFPDYTQRNKSLEKTGEGGSLVDFSIINEFNQTCDRHPMSRVMIWSLDSDLSAHDRRV